MLSANLDSPATTRAVYLDDAYCFVHEAEVVAVRGGALVLDRTCMYPGGGGQPPDSGTVALATGETLRVDSAAKDPDGAIRHTGTFCATDALVGRACRVCVDAERRLALMRHHTALHVFNTVMLREFDGWITGCSIGPAESHIDFKLASWSQDLRPRIETTVNDLLFRGLEVVSHRISPEEFRSRPELLRTLEAAPPVGLDGVRIVEIHGFEAQACGGTHVRNTAEVGALAIRRVDNKGKQNRRFYVTLAPPTP